MKSGTGTSSRPSPSWPLIRMSVRWAGRAGDAIRRPPRNCCNQRPLVVVVVIVPVSVVGMTVLQLLGRGVADAAHGDVVVEHFASERVVGVYLHVLSQHLDD